MKFKNPYQKHGLIILLILGLYGISTRVFNIQIPLTLIKIIIVVSLSVVFIFIGKFLYFNSSGTYFILKRIGILIGSIFIITFLWYFVLYYPVARDFKYCTGDVLTQLKSITKNLNEEELDIQTQCQIVKPIVSSFNKCVDTVREMNGGLVTNVVYKLAALPSGADSRIKKIEAACSKY